MRPRRGAGRRRLRSIPAIGLIALLLSVLAPPPAARAHPLDVFLQATYITVAPNQVEVELDLTPGVLVAPNLLPKLDTDGDQAISDAEARAYADTLALNLVLQVDGQPLALTVTEIDMPPYLTIQAGYGTIRIFTTATTPESVTGTHQIAYTNTYALTGSAYQVNAFVANGVPITLGTQDRDDVHQGMTLDFTVGGSETIVADPADAPVATTDAARRDAGRLLDYLDHPTRSPWGLALALGLAVALGGLHALTPGHGKTLAAAYLVGRRGTVRHAAALGAIVTFTHTASVVVIGLLALFASQWVVPGVLVPVLQIVSGALVVALGARLAWQRWGAVRQRRNPAHAHHHGHHHEHDHTHDHAHSHNLDHGLTHDHGDGRTHSHLPPAGGFKFGGLLAMGVSGGLGPCPEALGIMIVAVGLNRVMLGLGLIVSFSLGLAAVLIGIGILLVRSRSLVERFGGMGGRWSRVLPLGSAVIVTVLGAGIVLNGLANYPR